MLGAFPAVVVPSASKAGRNAASFSSDVSRRGPSSTAIPSTGTISSSKKPVSIACTARSCERSAQASWSSRAIPSSRETCDACSIMWRLSKVETRPSCVIRSITTSSPIR
jgi:hypothetical protein